MPVMRRTARVLAEIEDSPVPKPELGPVTQIPVANSSPIEVQKPLRERKSFSLEVAANGYLDPATGALFPPESILNAEVAPQERFGEGLFSEN